MLKKIGRAEFEHIIRDAELLEEDLHGPKVWLLPDQRILKTFRRKRLISSQIWMPHATRFAKNAHLLLKRKIPTVEIESTFQIPELERQAVTYKCLEGETLRDWMVNQDEESLILKLEKFGQFVACLHLEGILFRSIHFNNVLIIKNGEFGLIDISDMSFRWRGSLTTSQRIRNFHHMDRYDTDRIALSGKSGQHFIESYLEHSTVSTADKTILQDSFGSIFNKYTNLKN